MIYRKGMPQDMPAITQLVNDEGDHMPIDASVLADGGSWLLAEDESGLVGCIWALHSGQHAFVEYLVVRSDRRNGVGPRLCVQMALHLQRSNVKYVRAITKNRTVEKTIRSMGGITDPGYTAAGIFLGG